MGDGLELSKTQRYFGYWRKLVQNTRLLFLFLSPSEIFTGQNRTWTIFSRSYSVLPFKYQSTDAPCLSAS
jgi:hypothetical protein